MGLAEPKRKVKYSIDPNAQHWAKSDAKFGAKLMKKMGWEEGKGLGAKEDGMTEHIKVRFKDDTKGVGYTKNDYDDVWMDHQDDFEDLLKNLKGAADSDNNSSNGEEPTKSILNLEHAKTKTSQLRHPKLIKAKNLSKATNNDLDCILGTKKRKMKKLAEEEESSVPAASSKKDDESESECERRVCFKQTDDVSSTNKSLADSMSSVFTTNSQSIGDYFKNKMKARFNPASPQSPSEEPAVVEEEMEEEVEKKKKSKKSKKSKREEPEQVEEEPEPVIEEEPAEPEIKKKKKHKKSKETVENEEPVSTQEEAKNGEDDMEQEYFPGSNLFDINGYTPYVITATTNGLINERLKKAKVKQTAYQKNIEKDKNFYAMSKKSKHLE